MHLTKILHPLFFLFALLAVSPLQGQNSGKVYGKVLDTNDIPLQSVHIYIKGNSAVGSLSNEAGRFELSIEADKELLLVVSSLGYIPQEIPVKVSPGKRLQLTVVMLPSNTQLPEFSVSERYTPNTGVEYINPKPVAHLPSINSSIEGLIKSAGLGVTSHNELSSQYNVRGGNYDENLIYLNGIEVYRPFLIRSGQQEGLSFINPDMVSAVRFSSGGFDASYGDKMSSVLDVKYKTPIAFGGSVYASLLGGGAHLEGASKNQKFSYLAGLRYHSNAYLIRKLQTKGHYNPNFTDLQLLLNYKANARWSFRLFGNYARNSYHLIPYRANRLMALSTAPNVCVYISTGRKSTPIKPSLPPCNPPSPPMKPITSVSTWLFSIVRRKKLSISKGSILSAKSTTISARKSWDRTSRHGPWVLICTTDAISCWRICFTAKYKPPTCSNQIP